MGGSILVITRCGEVNVSFVRFRDLNEVTRKVISGAAWRVSKQDSVPLFRKLLSISSAQIRCQSPYGLFIRGSPVLGYITLLCSTIYSSNETVVIAVLVGVEPDHQENMKQQISPKRYRDEGPSDRLLESGLQCAIQSDADQTTERRHDEQEMPHLVIQPWRRKDGINQRKGCGEGNQAVRHGVLKVS